MSSSNPLPPFVIHSSTRLSQSAALAMLTTFLDRANNEPAYRPDSTLTERGPVSSSTDTKSDLTLHHLSRIKQGLEGKHLGPEDLENGLFSSSAATKKRKRDDDTEMPSSPSLPSQQNPAISNDDLAEPEPIVAVPDTTSRSEGWQDKDSYELAQDDEEIDMNNAQRDPGAPTDQQPTNEEEEEELVEIEIEGTGEVVDPRRDGEATNRVKKTKKQKTKEKSAPKKAVEDKRDRVLSTTPAPVDKDERKRLKKERQKLEKHFRSEARSSQKS